MRRRLGNCHRDGVELKCKRLNGSALECFGMLFIEMNLGIKLKPHIILSLGSIIIDTIFVATFFFF